MLVLMFCKHYFPETSTAELPFFPSGEDSLGSARGDRHLFHGRHLHRAGDSAGLRTALWAPSLWSVRERVGVAVQRWRKWMLRHSPGLTHQVKTKQTSQTSQTMDFEGGGDACRSNICFSAPDELLREAHCGCVCVQNGSIAEASVLWRSNVDKRFEGTEDCVICLSVIHGSSYSLPKKGRRTCRKKLHSACLVRALRALIVFYPQSSCWDFKMPETTALSFKAYIKMCVSVLFAPGFQTHFALPASVWLVCREK